jgi:hypothetical protein
MHMMLMMMWQSYIDTPENNGHHFYGRGQQF